MKKILETHVHDRPGVLDRIVGLIRRRGWNVDSLTAGEIGGGLTQLTMQLAGHNVDLESLGEALDDIDAVSQWRALDEATDCLRELLLFRVAEASPHCGQAGTRVLSREDGMAYCEVTALPSHIDALAEALRGEGIAYARSGPLSFVQPGQEGGIRDDA